MNARILSLLLAAWAGITQSPGAEREPWTASRIHGAPEPPLPYVAERAWPALEFRHGLEIVAAGGRVFVLERAGKAWSFPAAPDADSADLLVDLKEARPELDHLYGMAFHPRWKENGEVFLTYTTGSGLEDGSKLSRFRLLSMDPPALDPGSEEILLTWLSGGHNGASIRFGPLDGYLYLSTGDATPPAPPDALNTGQDNSDLLSAILRLDVDRRDPGLAYAVPPDNPWTAEPGTRPEIWAFGFRNPWKISFDESGRLWCGDVGWELWEMIHLVTRGGNYGWSAMEASQPIKPETASSLAPITPPLIAHPHTEAASITGGFVYQGSRLPALQGAYVYGDYETGKIWALWHDGERLARHEEIADTPCRIATFGLLEDGEIVFADYADPTTLHRLAPNPRAGQSSEFPRRLGEAGLFSDVASLAPETGVHSFEVAEPLWEGGLAALRHVALPGNTAVETSLARHPDGRVRQASHAWPEDAVLARTLVTPEPAARKVETQLLHFDGRRWNGYSYLWNEDQTDAELVEALGAEAAWPGAAPGDPPWRHRVHGRAECSRCHTGWSGHVLGFQPQQLLSVAGGPAEAAAVELGLVGAEFFQATETRLASSRDIEADLELRARSWLHANCAHCHRLHGGGSVLMKLNAELSLAETLLLGRRPEQGNLGIEDARLLAPGAPWRSALLARTATTGPGQMPPLGSRAVDAEGWGLLWEWIASLEATPDEPLSPASLAADDRDAALLEDIGGAPGERLMELAGTSQGVLRVARALDQGAAEGDAAAVAAAIMEHHPQGLAAGLLERFLPPEQRRPVIGQAPDRARLLALPGDPARGAALLSPQGKLASCLGCHLLHGTGRDFGPDLSQAGARLTREQLLDSLLDPSAEIAPEFTAHAAELADGTTHLGFPVSQSDTEIVLKLATGQTLALPRAELKSWNPLPASLMPPGLIASLTAEEAADLLAYLASLR